MIQLSKRLHMVADMVTKGNRVADIGCDHAHTSIYLVEREISKRIIAMDINRGPLERAKENIKKHQCEDFIEIRLSDGARKLKTGEVDSLLISGMGGALIIHILEDSKEVIQNLEEMILQPQSEIEDVRKYLHSIGFSIINEDMLIEDGKHYTAIYANKGVECYRKELEYRYGKILLEKKNEALKEYLIDRRKKYAKVIAKLKNQEYDRNRKRLSELESEDMLMEEALKEFD